MTRKTKKIGTIPAIIEDSKPGPFYRLYLEEHLKARGWSDAFAAQQFGVAYATMYRWRKSQRDLNAEKIAKFAHVLGLQPEELWHPPGDRRAYQIVNMLQTLDEDSFGLVLKLIQHLYVITAMKRNTF